MLEPSGRTRLQIGPTTGSGFVSMLLPVVLSRFRFTLSPLARTPSAFVIPWQSPSAIAFITCLRTTSSLHRPCDNSESKPAGCFHDPFAVFAATQPLSQRSACIHQSLRAMVAHASTGIQRLQSVFPGLRDTLPNVSSRLLTVDSETPCRRAAKSSPHCATTVSMRRLFG